MISLDQRITLLHHIGEEFRIYLASAEKSEHWLAKPIRDSFISNGWFTNDEVHRSLQYWSEALHEDILKRWIENYNLPQNNSSPKNVAIVMAGNIPMVGFHDFLSVFLTGNIAQIKCSSSDNVLIPAILQFMISKEAGAHELIKISGGKLNNFDLVIATGSNNSARYFEEYFGRVPHVIRRNRTSVAIIEGNEADSEMEALMSDAFTYFGLGCRNVTKLYIPKGFDLNKIFKASLPFNYLMSNKKYVNNYTYYKALMMLERKPFLDNDLMLLVEDEKLYSPVSVINYEWYSDKNDLNQLIEKDLDNIQCVMGASHRPYGTAQAPALNDYADGVDTIKFLVENAV